MSGRLVIPIHDEAGQLIAYAGRSLSNRVPRYLFPRGFQRSQVLFNLHRVQGDEAIMVEGFFDCMKVWQRGWKSVIALMGCSLSTHQENLVVNRFRRVTLMLDGDDSGRRGAETIATQLLRTTHVRIVDVPQGAQPDMLTEADLAALLTRST